MKEGLTHQTGIVLESKPASVLAIRSKDDVQPAADVAALFLLGLLAFLLVCFAVGAVAMARRSRRFSSQWVGLHEDSTHGSRHPLLAESSPPESDARQEWERDPDWWKRD